MTSREKFQQWWQAEVSDLPPKPWNQIYCEEGDYYMYTSLDLYYDIWKASRASLVVELPEVCAWNISELLDKKDVITVLRVAGITVKGE